MVYWKVIAKWPAFRKRFAFKTQTHRIIEYATIVWFLLHKSRVRLEKMQKKTLGLLSVTFKQSFIASSQIKLNASFNVSTIGILKKDSLGQRDFLYYK